MNRLISLPEISNNYIDSFDNFLLFETCLPDTNNYISYIFTNPIDIITLYHPHDIPRAFEQIEKYVKKHYLAGYFAYEMGYCIDELLWQKRFFNKSAVGRKDVIPAEYPFPLIRLGVFNKVVQFDHRTGKTDGDFESCSLSKKNKEQYRIKRLELNVSRSQYLSRIKYILNRIGCGDVYQVNYTIKYHFDFEGSAFGLYRHLSRAQPVPYSAFLKWDSEYVLSLSPELFFMRDGDYIASKPMKGTIARGKTNQEDAVQSKALYTSEKDRAENIMITDLIRNDLGHICCTGSIAVPALYTIEKYPTLFQMTSTVIGRLKKDTTYYDIFKAIFPCGSVTGAPKISAMSIIQSQEQDFRNVYCGAVGIIFPTNKAIFNVPIRTVLLNRGRGEMGIGSGIVSDSLPQAEYRECILKGSFLQKRRPAFSIIETLLWDNEYTFLKEHLDRMEDSAEYFSYSYCFEEAMTVLNELAKQFQPGKRCKVRLLLNMDGSIDCSYEEIDSPFSGKRYVTVSHHYTDPDDIFLYHKTTNRVLYNREYARYSQLGFYDVLFLNNRNEVTEGAVSNIFIKKDGVFLTPPVSSGLLNGIYRQHIIKTNGAQEQIMMLDGLKSADAVYICNSVRGLAEVKIKL